MTSYVPIVKNNANGAIFYVSLAPRTANGQWQSNPTLAAGDVKISLDGGSLNNLNTLPAVTPASSKLVKVTLSQAETNADNLSIVFSDAAGAEWCDLTINLQTAAKQFDDLASQTTADNIYSRLGAPVGASISADIAGVQSDTDNIQTRLPTSLVSGRIDASVGAMANDVVTAAAIAADAIGSSELAASAVTEIQSGLSTLDAAGVRAAVGLASANLDTQLDALPTTAEVNTEVDTALSDAGVTSVRMAHLDVDISSRLASGSYTAPPSAATIAQAVWDALTSALTTVGSVGKLLVTNVDAAITSRLASGSYAAPDNASITAIKAKTDNLPSDPADQSLIIAATDAIKGDTAAIKTKTDQLAFTGGNVDANIEAVNGTAVTGTGTGGDPWGPA